MRAISIQCPNCAAKLEAGEAAHTVRCTYCGTQARIQHRTRFLERKIELPPPPPQQRHMPVAQQKHGIKWMVGVTSLLPLLMAGGITFYTMKKTGGLDRIGEAISEARSAASKAMAGTDGYTFPGIGNVLLYDVDGDGLLDILSPIRYAQKNDSYHLAAFEGRSGSKLWEATSFGNHGDATNGRTALLGDTLVQSDSRGNISGFSAKTGELLWKKSMGEKLSQLCADSGGSLALGLKDKNWKSINLADGTLTPLEDKPEACLRVSEIAKHGQANEVFTADTRHARTPKIKVESMRVKNALSRLSEPGRFVLIGHKTPGTRVPMVALAHSSELDEPAEVEEPEDGKKRKKRKRARAPKFVLDWSSELPALDPLSVDEGEPPLVSINDNYIAALYEPKEGPPHVVCFSREGGRRIWDTPLPDSPSFALTALDMTEDRVYVSHWSRMVAIDVETGSVVFKLGQL